MLRATETGSAYVGVMVRHAVTTSPVSASVRRRSSAAESGPLAAHVPVRMSSAPGETPTVGAPRGAGWPRRSLSAAAENLRLSTNSTSLRRSSPEATSSSMPIAGVTGP